MPSAAITRCANSSFSLWANRAVDRHPTVRKIVDALYGGEDVRREFLGFDCAAFVFLSSLQSLITFFLLR